MNRMRRDDVFLNCDLLIFTLKQRKEIKTSVCVVSLTKKGTHKGTVSTFLSLPDSALPRDCGCAANLE